MRTPAVVLLTLLTTSIALVSAPARADDTSLRFHGHGTGDVDRVKIAIDAPERPADVGLDFTIELWLKATPGENDASGCSPSNDGWITGNIVVDRDVYGPGDLGDYGLSLFEEGLAFGVAGSSGGAGLCGATPLDDGLWHHVAVTRDASSGQMRLWVDGVLDGSASGPTGDVSYADGRSGAPNDPFLVIGAEKHDAGPAYPSFSGWVDELRLSGVVRYSATFTPPAGPFVTDADTVALYHFDDAPAGPCTGTVLDASGAAGGPSDGVCSHGGGGTSGPRFSTDVPSYGAPPGDLLAAGKSLLVRDHATRPTQRKMVLTSSDAGLVAPAAGGPADPRLAGATLVVARGSAEVATMTLPAQRWVGLGNPAGSRGYRYVDARRESGPCTRVVLKDRGLTATCAGSQLGFTLDEPAQGALAVGFTPGTGRRACLAFGGIVSKDVSTSPGPLGQFRARLAPPPASCPLP